MSNHTNNLYMEQIINESGIKGIVCSKSDCTVCNNIISCYMDASKREDNIVDVNYGGYDTETHY